MKKSIVIFALFVIQVISAQTWNAEVASLSTGVIADTKIASTADYQGVHVLFLYSGNLKYTKLNSSGSATSAVTIETGIGNYARIETANGKLYAIYPKENLLKVALSADGGSTWNTSYASRTISGSTINGLTSAIDNRGLHISWSEGDTYTSEVYYERCILNLSTPMWADYKNVTDESSNPNGAMPSIALSGSKVHIGYHTVADAQYGADRTRDFVWESNTWQSTLAVPLLSWSRRSQIAVINNTLHVVYQYYYGNMYGSSYSIKHFTRDVNGTSWTENTTLGQEYYSSGSFVSPMEATNTDDGKLHLFFLQRTTGTPKHFVFNGSAWSDATPSGGLSWFEDKKLAVTGKGNDVYMVRVYDNSVPGGIYYRQYDAAPVIPTNVSINTSSGILVQWARNPEPDIQLYEVWRKTGSTYNLLETTSGTSIVDPDFSTGGNQTLSYKVRAKDYHPYTSDYSSVVSINNAAPYKRNFETAVTPTEFALLQNYPNPFNPTTTIAFELPQDANVSLEVFDMLGRNVATLVNEFREAGRYSHQFDASRLSSGVYYYTLRAGNFNATKHFTLVK